MVAIDHQIEKEAFEKANQKVLEAKSEKQKELERKQDNMEDLIDQVAKMIIDQNKNIVGKDVAQKAIEKVNEDTVKRRGRPKKQVNTEEGGTNENEQEKQAKGRRVTKTA